MLYALPGSPPESGVLCCQSIPYYHKSFILNITESLLLNNAHFHMLIDKIFPYYQVEIDQISEAVAAGRCCRVFGPPNRGKTKALRQAAARLQAAGYAVVFVQMGDIPRQSLTNEHVFARGLQVLICHQIAADLASHAPLDHFFVALARSITSRLVLFLDDLDVLPSDLVLALIEAVTSALAQNNADGDVSFQVVTASAMPLPDGVQDFNRIAALVLFADLNDDERQMFARQVCAEKGVRIADAALESLFSETGGDYFLIDALLKIALSKTSFGDTLAPDAILWAADELTQSVKSVVIEPLRVLEQDADVLALTLRALEFDKTTLVSATDRVRYATLGFFWLENGICKVKSLLWKRLLHAFLTPDRIGMSYAASGRWEEAIRYLGIASEGEAPPEMRALLYTTILSALRASDNLTEALRLLGHGLSAMYPQAKLDIYSVRDEHTLEREYTTRTDRRQTRIISLSAQSFENRALCSADYVVMDEAIGLPVYLKGEKYALVVLDWLERSYRPEQQAPELRELVRFLQQAAPALRVRQQFDQMLRQPDEYLERLRAISHLLTFIQRHQPATAALYKLLLAGVTSGWTLGFNRALVLVPDRSGKVLRCEYAVGHLTRQEALDDWNNFKHDNLESLLLYILENRDTPTPFLNRVQDMVVPLVDDDNLFAQAFHGRRLIAQSGVAGLPPDFVDAVQPEKEYVILPLEGSRGVVGVLYADDQHADFAIAPERLALLRTFARRAAETLELLSATATPLQHNDRLKRLNDTFQFLRRTAEQQPQNLYEAIVTAARSLFDDTYCAVFYVLQKGETAPYETENILSSPPELAEKTQPIRAGQGLGDRIIREGLLAIADLRLHPPIYDTQSGATKNLTNTFIRGQRIRAFAGVRLGSADVPTGVLYLNWQDKHELTQVEQETLRLFVEQASHLIEDYRWQEDYRLNQAETESFDRLLSNLTLQPDRLNLDKEIGDLLRGAAGAVPDVRMVLKAGPDRWREYQIDAAQQVVYRDLTTARDGEEDKKKIGFIKQIIHHFQSARDKDRDHFAWERTFSGRSGYYLVAANVRIGANTLAVLYCELPVQVAGVKYRHHPQILRCRHMLARYNTKRLAVTLRLFDMAETLVGLRALSATLAEDYDPGSIARQVVDTMARTLRFADAIRLYYRDDVTGELRLSVPMGVQNPPEPETFREDFERLLNIGQPVIGDKNPLGGGIRDKEDFLVRGVFPLRGANPGSPNIGLLLFFCRIQHDFDEGERNILQLFAETTAIALNRAFQHRELEREKSHLQIVKDLAFAINSLNPNEVIRTILETVRDRFRDVAHNFALVEYDEQDNRLVIGPVSLEFYRVDRPPKKGQPYTVGTGERLGLAGRAIKDRERIIANDIIPEQMPDYIPAIRSTRSQICVPCSERAALVVESHFTAPFNERQHSELLALIADYAAIALQKAQMYDDLERAKEQKWRQEIAALTAGLAHDMRGIMGAIRQALGEMKNTSDDFGTLYAEPLGTIEDALDRVHKVNELLEDFLKNKKFNPEHVPLRELINGGIELAKDYRADTVTPKITKKHLRARVHVDRVWIQLLLKNLLQNAYEAIKRAGRPGEIEVSVERNEYVYYILVRDNGDGIPQDKWEKIFNLFYSEYSRQDTALQGLGLYYCRELAKVHGGKLYVRDSAVGKGTTMCLELPMTASYQSYS